MSMLFSRSRNNTADSIWGSGSSSYSSASDNSSILESDTERGTNNETSMDSADSGGFGWNLIRRRGGVNPATNSSVSNNNNNKPDGDDDHGHKRRRNAVTTTGRCGPRSCYCRCCRCCKYFTLIYLMIFFARQMFLNRIERTRYKLAPNPPMSSNPALPIRERTKLRIQNNQAANSGGAFLQQVRNSVAQDVAKTRTKDDEMPDGCERPEWQEYSFPNCNDFHSIDIQAALMAPRKEGDPHLGYVNSGLWRSVWAVNPVEADKMPVVLKMMEMEHDVTSRNFDRHRRDALTMEMLSGNSYVVDGYGFCGNSVLTEFLDLPLDSVDKEDETYLLGTEGKLTKITGKMRIQWATDMARGVQALHEVPGGPIVHADLQSKQFLVSPETGRVKVNDFNRCRFMAHRKGKEEEPCKFVIPSAPGKQRSPEEYKYHSLDEKLDIYSTANILYTLLTKKRAWDDLNQLEAKNFVKKGNIPRIWVDDKDNELPDDIKKQLIDINERAYILDPRKRISAGEMASELQKLLDQLEDTNTDAA